LRALVVRAGALGDLILLRPVVASLRAAGASVTLLAPERPGSALLGTGPEDAQRLISWDGPAVPQLMAGTAPSGFGDYDVVLCYSRSSDLARGLETVSPRVVTRDPEPPARTNDRPDPMHAADWLAKALPVPRVEPAPARPTAEEARAARRWLDVLPRGFVAVHPGSGSPRKNWPLDRFVEVARRLSADRPWMLSLGPAEADAAPPGAVIARDLPPRLLGTVLSSASVYVGNDSGVSHVAAAWSAPTLALFGPTDPAVWSPRGPRVRTWHARDGQMASISVDDVEACCRALVT
jgi:heptosyltransferase III